MTKAVRRTECSKMGDDMLLRWPAVLLLIASTGAYAQTKEHAPVALESADELSQDKPRTESWTYIKAGLSLKGYDAIQIVPTSVYKGADAQFNGIDQEDRVKFAEILTGELREELAKAMPLTPKARRGAIVVHAILLGAEPTSTGVATASRASTIGLATSAMKSLTGKPGSFTGSMLVAVEIEDGATGELLAAAVRRRSPDALDIPATLSTTDTIKAVSRDFAKTLRNKIAETKERSK